MELIDEIVEARNFREAWMSVMRNHGAASIDKIPVEVIDVYRPCHIEEIKSLIKSKQHKPFPVKRVYIPKSNGKQRPLGIPTVVDRVVQQVASQVLSKLYEPVFSDPSYGSRPNRSCHKAIGRVVEYLNDGYEWVVNFDIKKYFDTVKVKQWKRCGTIYKNLLTLKRIVKSNLDDTSIYQVAMTKLGWYRQCGIFVFNYLLSPKVLAMPKVNSTDKRKS